MASASRYTLPPPQDFRLPSLKDLNFQYRSRPPPQDDNPPDNIPPARHVTQWARTQQQPPSSRTSAQNQSRLVPVPAPRPASPRPRTPLRRTRPLPRTRSNPNQPRTPNSSSRLIAILSSSSHNIYIHATSSRTRIRHPVLPRSPRKTRGSSASISFSSSSRPSSSTSSRPRFKSSTTPTGTRSPSSTTRPWPVSPRPCLPSRRPSSLHRRRCSMRLRCSRCSHSILRPRRNSTRRTSRSRGSIRGRGIRGRCLRILCSNNTRRRRCMRRTRNRIRSSR
ncbi:hypothetical protein B0H16DRAFT_149870 [Mycena metata]|uniref:Uncharacterized protein n=1 Tax=Mycena metata TaxID=1033252 RepID=A0AAD7JZ63_9AGAR|nr:hypothetical protein B0H16DRAFT_149870 [Mycena metata]